MPLMQQWAFTPLNQKKQPKDEEQRKRKEKSDKKHESILSSFGKRKHSEDENTVSFWIIFRFIGGTLNKGSSLISPNLEFPQNGELGNLQNF